MAFPGWRPSALAAEEAQGKGDFQGMGMGKGMEMRPYGPSTEFSCLEVWGHDRGG